MYEKHLIYILIIVFISCNQDSNKQLPIYNPVDFNPKLVDKSIRDINKNHRVSDFNLINQNGSLITSKDYKNKIYVVDFFFTSCPSICPIMTNNMLKIQDCVINPSHVIKFKRKIRV